MNRNSCVGKEQRTVVSLYYNVIMKRVILPTAKKKLWISLIIVIPWRLLSERIDFRKIVSNVHCSVYVRTVSFLTYTVQVYVWTVSFLTYSEQCTLERMYVFHKSSWTTYWIDNYLILPKSILYWDATF